MARRGAALPASQAPLLGDASTVSLLGHSCHHARQR
jgi:hypothetical protein